MYVYIYIYGTPLHPEIHLFSLFYHNIQDRGWLPYISPIKLTMRRRTPLVVSTECWDSENLYKKEWFLALWALTKSLGF